MVDEQQQRCGQPVPNGESETGQSPCVLDPGHEGECIAILTPVLDDPLSDDALVTHDPLTDGAAHAPTEEEGADIGRPGTDGIQSADRDELLARLEAADERRARMKKHLRAIYRREFDGLHPNILEALKRLEVAEAEWDRARRNIEGQYLKSLENLDADAAAQADAVRALMEL